MLRSFQAACAGSLLNFAMPNPSELIACSFPLWKRGTKGDLQSLSTSERQKIPLDPPFPKGEGANLNHLLNEYGEFQQTASALASV